MPDAAQIETELARQADIHVAVEESEGEVILTGMIGSQGQRQAAFDIVAGMAPGKRIVDNLELDDVLPENINGLDLSEAAVGDFPAATPETADNEALEPGDFTDQSLLSYADGAGGPGEADDRTLEAAYSEGEEVYVPAMDPVLGPDDEVLGGFSVSSLDEVPVESSVSDRRPGDEALADAVRRELREDAATTDLRIQVSVHNGVVRLRGVAPSLIDAENAEAVAGRVPGVEEVEEELEVSGPI
jgi:osmotically-inducible protein OsmY